MYVFLDLFWDSAFEVVVKRPLVRKGRSVRIIRVQYVVTELVSKRDLAMGNMKAYYRVIWCGGGVSSDMFGVYIRYVGGLSLQ